MYFYLSFLRPPPVSSPVGEPIVVTPQVANDLRTELYEDELRISYQWRLDGASASTQPAALTPAQPLTTWHGSSSAYKALAIDPPKGAKAGEAWSLALFCPAAAAATPAWKTDLVQLARVHDESADGRRWVPVPVSSEPVRFTARAKGGAPAGGAKPSAAKGKGKAGAGADKVEKQDRIVRALVLPEAAAADERDDGVPREIVLTEQTSFDLDKKIWDSGLACSAFFADRLGKSAGCGLVRLSEEGEAHFAPVGQLLANDEGRRLRILELGTGSGLVSIALASLLPPASTFNERHQLYATDLPSAMPLVARNLATNAHLFAQTAEVHGRPLDWYDESLPEWAWGEPGEEKEEVLRGEAYDLILLVDVTYNLAVFPALLRTLSALLSPPPHVVPRPRPTRFVLAWKERDPTGAEKELWRLAEELGIRLDLVGQDGGHGGMPVEYWVGRLRE